MLNSKRFLAFLIAVGLFISMVFFTDYPPLELSGAISMICGVYTASETLRGSSPTKDTTITTDSTTTENNTTVAVNTVETKKN